MLTIGRGCRRKNSNYADRQQRNGSDTGLIELGSGSHMDSVSPNVLHSVLCLHWSDTFQAVAGEDCLHAMSVQHLNSHQAILILAIISKGGSNINSNNINNNTDDDVSYHDR